MSSDEHAPSDEYGRLADALGRNPEFDLPNDRDDFALVAEFLDRNPTFDTAAPDEKIDKLRALQGADRDVYVPERNGDLERLIALLKRYEDLDLLARFLEADDTGALVDALGIGGATAHPVGAAETTSPSGDDGAPRAAEEGLGALIADDEDEEDDGDLFGPGNLDPFGERIGHAAGGIVSLFAVALFLLQGVSFDLNDTESWLVAFRAPNGDLVVVATAAVALVAGCVAGFGYRAFVDEPTDGYRQDLTEAIFIVPFVGTLLAIGLYVVGSTAGISLLAGDVAAALGQLVLAVVVLAIVLTPVLVGMLLGVGTVVGAPAFAGVIAGSLLGKLAST